MGRRISESNSPDTSIGSQTLADEALVWLVKLHSGRASEEDWRRCKAWREKSPAHRLAYQEAEGLWQDVGTLRPFGSIHKTPSQLLTGRLPSRWKRWAAVAACLLLAAGMLWMEHDRQWIGAAMADYRTGMGEQRVITLEDGSSLHLNTDTAVNIAFSADRRDLQLLKGEASFTVASDPTRPFVVKSGTVLTRALGTAFAIRRHAGMITVTVMEHQVELGVSSESAFPDLTVHEGEQVRYSAEAGFSPVRRIDLGKETAWQRGKVIFEAQPLADVVEELNRHRHGQIIILNPALRALKVTGLFDTAEPDAALRMIQQTIPIRHTNLTSYLVLLH
jgi:transmembrane sensor